ncbi:hypothetical protein L9F63_016214, partial [Diploptera punctata]
FHDRKHYLEELAIEDALRSRRHHLHKTFLTRRNGKKIGIVQILLFLDSVYYSVITIIKSNLSSIHNRLQTV